MAVELRRILDQAIAKGFSDVALNLVKISRTMVKIANSEPSVVQYWDDYVLEMYLAKDRRLFILELRGLDPSRVDYTFEQLLNLSTKIKESELYAPLPEPQKPVQIEGMYDEGVVKYMENPLDIVEEMINTAHEERIDYIAGMLDLAYVEEELATSRGFEGKHIYTSMESYIRAFAGDEGSGQWSTCSTKMRRDKLRSTARIAATYAVESRKRVDVEPGHYDVILSPMVFGNLLEYVTHMATGFSILAGMSMFMRNKLGDRVASERLTVVDNPHDPELPMSRGFDLEGVATAVKPIIERGVLKTILHNSATAAKFGTRSTGNAGWVSPTPWNIVVEPGDYKLDELVREVRRGLMITNNWYTRFQNFVEGMFSTIARDAIFLIENGEIRSGVKRVRIADRLSSVLQNIDGMTRDVYDIRWWEVTYPTRAPYILARNVNISKHLL